MFVQHSETTVMVVVVVATATHDDDDIWYDGRVSYLMQHICLPLYEWRRARARAHMKTTFIVGVEKWQKTPASEWKYSLYYLFRWCCCCCYCCFLLARAKMEQTLKHPFVSSNIEYSEQTAEKLLQFTKEYCHTVVHTTTIRINFIFGSTFPFPSCYR